MLMVRPVSFGAGVRAKRVAVDGGVQRHEQPDVMSVGVQVLGERRGDIGEPPGLGKGRHLGGDGADSHRRGAGTFCQGDRTYRLGYRLHCGSAVTGAFLLRRQWLIGLILIVIFVVSIGVGVVVASWPHCCQL